jgi:hemerythrin
MSKISKIRVANGIYWVEVPEVDLYVLCGCPTDSVKHLMKRELIRNKVANGVTFETGPNAVLLSDVSIQNGSFANLAEFPVLQMLYRQGMIMPNHPQNTGRKPLLMGAEKQVESQMQYIYRGNYGLISEDEIMEAGVSKKKAEELMRLKLRFAFGKIKAIEEFFEARIVRNVPVEIRDGVFVNRLKVNIFEFEYQGESLTVDLNLAPHEIYESPYSLGFYNIKREYFAVVHSGEGNGWDIHRPCMSSIIMFQGRIYLVDSGPNIQHSLKSLGISVNEIEGIFHTHAHDDHFAGLTTLMRSDHKIKYFAAPLVRASVSKKLSALTSVPEENLNHFFDVHDLEIDRWNDISGMEVKPVFSPHPIETTIFMFRTLGDGGYRTYAHMADLIGLNVLKEMINEDDSAPGVTQEFFEQVKQNYLKRVDLKKLDAEGGFIHGNVMDFKGDTSGKIILAHTSSELTSRQKEVGSQASFGMVDVLVSSFQEYVRKYAFYFLKTDFPSVPPYQIDVLMNHPIVTFNPGSNLLRREECNKYIYLILTGDVEIIRAESEIVSMLSSGGVVGEDSGLTKSASKETCRAVNFVQALQWPCDLYIDFIKRNGLYEAMVELRERRAFLQNTWLLGAGISYPIQNKLAQAMTLHAYAPGQVLANDNSSGISIIKRGQVQLFLQKDIFEILKSGDFFGESNVLFEIPDLFRVRAIDDTDVYKIERETLLEIPIVHWKLVEIYKKRIGMMLNPEFMNLPIFKWREAYRVNIQEMDEDHEKIFQLANKLSEAIDRAENVQLLEDILESFVHHTHEHFDKEERLMAMHGFPGLSVQRDQHKKFRVAILEYRKNVKSGKTMLDTGFSQYLKDWFINHFLTEDRKYGVYLNRQGIF